MSDPIGGKTADNLTAKTTPAETDYILMAENKMTKRTKISDFLTFLKDKLGINTLNTNIGVIGKSAKFYAGGNFYAGGSSDYTGLAIGNVARNNIDGLKFVGASDYKHYFEFPQGTYLININLFMTINNGASTSNVLGAALKIAVDDVDVANPWFRMIDSWQSIIYPIIVTGSKLKVTMYTDRLVEIQSNVATSFVEFVRIA